MQVHFYVGFSGLAAS